MVDVCYQVVQAAAGFVSVIITGAILFSGATPYHTSALSGQA